MLLRAGIKHYINHVIFEYGNRNMDFSIGDSSEGVFFVLVGLLERWRGIYCAKRQFIKNGRR